MSIGNSSTSINNISGEVDFPEFCDNEPPASIITKPISSVSKPTVDPIKRVEMLGQILQEAFLQSRPAVVPYQKPSAPIVRPTISPQHAKTNVRAIVGPNPTNPIASTSRVSPPTTTVAAISDIGKNKVVAYLPNTPHLLNNQMDKTVYVSTSVDSADYLHNLNPWIQNYKCRKPNEVSYC